MASESDVLTKVAEVVLAESLKDAETLIAKIEAATKTLNAASDRLDQLVTKATSAIDAIESEDPRSPGALLKMRLASADTKNQADRIVASMEKFDVLVRSLR